MGEVFKKTLLIQRFNVLVIGTNVRAIENIPGVKNMFIQEKRISIGNYQEVDLIPLTEDCLKGNRGRRKKRKEIIPRPAQQNNNDKKSRRYFGLLAKGNFKKGDYYLTLTFKQKYLPDSPEEAKKILKDTFLRKIKNLYKKAGILFKYLSVMEFQEDEKKIKRIHFHLLISGGVNRDLVEDCWSVGRGKKKERLGRTNARIIQPDSDGITALVNYLKKDPRWKKGIKTWSGSRNLERPIKQTNNSKYSMRKIEKYALSNDHGLEELVKQYQDFWITSVKPIFNDLKGWHIYLEMVKKEVDE